MPGTHLLPPNLLNNTRIILLDPSPPEQDPLLDLWTRFSPLPIQRLDDFLSAVENTQKEYNIILPLAGGANTFWQADWDVLDCPKSDLVDALVRRVFNLHHLPDHGRADRTGKIHTRMPALDRGERIGTVAER